LQQFIHLAKLGECDIHPQFGHAQRFPVLHQVLVVGLDAAGKTSLLYKLKPKKANG
jgi:hypothetical protein